MARIDAKERPVLLNGIEIYQGTHLTRLAMKLMMLTCARTIELISVRWDEVDFEAHRWNFLDIMNTSFRAQSTLERPCQITPC